MSSMNKWYFILGVFLMGCGMSDETRPLVSVSHISKNLEKGRSVQVIDIRTIDEYEAGHIPSAVQIHRSQLMDYNHEVEGMRIKSFELEQLLGSLGISHKDSVYLYDGKGNVDAARLWWIMNLYGFEEVALIDGGYINWLMENHEIEKGISKKIRREFRFLDKKRPELVVSKEDVEEGNYEQLVDVRTDEEYFGKTIKNGAFRPGHIPGAVQLEYEQFFTDGSLTLRNREQLLSILESMNLSQDKNTVAYCHSGVRSSFATFVFTQIVGMEHVSNYDGSWIEWSGDESLPIETESHGIKTE